MSLTTPHGPLSGAPGDANYQIDGPAHRLFFDDFPRRVSARFNDVEIFDSRRAKLLYETGLLPQLYVPRVDVSMQHLVPTSHTTHCPFKGEAAYWNVRVGERATENAAWAYPRSTEAASWLRDYIAFYWKAMDAWFDEDEPVEGHLRDPYHRVDVRKNSQSVRVVAGRETVAETRHAVLLSETGLPNRYYVPLADTRRELLVASATHTVCPYKGTASYYSLRRGEGVIDDAAWYYPEPFGGVSAIRDHVCFLAEGVVTEVDGERVA